MLQVFLWSSLRCLKYHFCLCLLVKQITKANLDSRAGEAVYISP